MWLRDHKALMHEDTEPDGLIADGEALVPRLQALSPTKASAKSATVEDTEEIDCLTGAGTCRSETFGPKLRPVYRWVSP